MAKGQQKSNRETKKPKQAKKPAPAAALPSRAEPTKPAPAPARKK